jgi:acylglycerol lipase
VHGFSEHINRYNAFFTTLASSGIQVFAWDQRGWGRSAPTKSDWGLTGTTTVVVGDVAAFIKDKISGDVPLFVMGHSMGGGEVATLMGDPEYKELVSKVRGFVLECPFIGFSPGAEPNAITVAVGRFASRFLPKFQMEHIIPPEYLSHDPQWAESVRNDPLCHNTGTLQGLASMLDRTAVLSSGSVKLGKQVQSLWLAHGTDDKTCSFDAAMKWLEAQQNVKDKSSKRYEGAYHQLHADDCKEEFGRDLVAWILERCDVRPAEAKL